MRSGAPMAPVRGRLAERDILGPGRDRFPVRSHGDRTGRIARLRVPGHPPRLEIDMDCHRTRIASRAGSQPVLDGMRPKVERIALGRCGSGRGGPNRAHRRPWRGKVPTWGRDTRRSSPAHRGSRSGVESARLSTGPNANRWGANLPGPGKRPDATGQRER